MRSMNVIVRWESALPIQHALLRERVHTLRLPAVKLSFCSWHWSAPHNGGGDGHPLNRGAGRELILGGL